MFSFKKANGKHKFPGEDPNSIGNLAVELGYMTKDQLEDVLFEQRVRRGEITDKDKMIEHQRARQRRKVRQIRDGFRELREDSKRFSEALFDGDIEAAEAK